MSTSPISDPNALLELATNQRLLLLHAMRFPALLALCYSTCSVHEAENEEVVGEVLSQQQQFELTPALPWWPRRGHKLGSLSDGVAEHISRSVV